MSGYLLVLAGSGVVAMVDRAIGAMFIVRAKADEDVNPGGFSDGSR